MTGHRSPALVRSALAIGLTASLLVATGCSSDEGPSGPAGDTETTDGAGDTATTTPGSPRIDVNTPPGSGEGFVGALKDISDQACEAVDGLWRASGTVTNPTDEPVTYRIYVSYLDAARETVALIETDTDVVEAEESTSWETALASEATQLECVLRVERTPA